MKQDSFPENVQQRPGMYVGDTESKEASAQMVFELLGNAVDEHMAGHATEIAITTSENEAEVTDNGRGLRFGTHSSPGKDVFTEIHTTGTRDGHTPHVHLTSALHGAGLAVVCALSELVVAESAFDGRVERRAYSMGRPSGPPQHLGSATWHGTRVKIRPSRAVFASTIPIDVVADRVRELSFLLPGCKLSLNGTRLTGGTLSDFCVALANGALVAPPLHVRLLVRDVLVDVAVAWRTNIALPIVNSYVSTFRTKSHGTHVLGFFRGLRRGADETQLRAPAQAAGSAAFRRRLGQGLVAVVHAGLYTPRFGDPTKDRLLNPEAQRAVSAAVAMAFPAYVNQYPLVRQHLIALLADTVNP